MNEEKVIDQDEISEEEKEELEDYIDSFELLKENDEEILWQSKFPDSELTRRGNINRKYVHIVLLDILLYLVLSNLIRIHEDAILNFVLLFLIIQSPLIVILGILIINAEDFYEYKSTEYYITNKRILLRYNYSDPYWGDDAFCSLELKHIKDIEIKRDKKNPTLYHIYFRSDFIKEKPKDYYFYVAREDSETRKQGEIYPVKGWLNTQDDSSLKFSYVDNIDTIISNLKKLLPEHQIRRK